MEVKAGFACFPCIYVSLFLCLCISLPPTPHIAFVNILSIKMPDIKDRINKFGFE